MPLEKLVLEGIVSTSSRPPGIGRLVFDHTRYRYWTCTLEYADFTPQTKYLLVSKDIDRIPSNFIKNASQGHFWFHHKTSGGIITLRCNPSKVPNLEDAVILIMAINNDKSFEIQKVESGFAVHETFLKCGGLDDGRRRNGVPRSIGNGYGGRATRNRRDKRAYSGTPYRVPDKEQFYNGGFRSNSGEYKRNDSYNGGRGKMRSPPKCYSDRTANYGKFNGFRDRRSFDSPSEEYRNREHVSRRQQPLKDRGSAENSLDRSEEDRETSFLGQSPVKNKSDKTSNDNSSDRNENLDPERGSPIRATERLVSSLSTTPSPSREVDQSLVKVESESPFSRGAFYGKVSRHFGPNKSPSPSTYRRLNSFYAKRTGPIWSSTSKKNKYDASNFENKENELETSSSSYRQLGNCDGELGFKNIGLTCYMNTCLRSLFNVGLFSHDLLLTYDFIKDFLDDSSITRSVCNLLIATRSPDKSKYGDSYKNLLVKIQEVIDAKWKGFKICEMQDALEFFQRFLNSLKDEVNDKLKLINGKPMISLSALNPIRHNIEFVVEEVTTCCNCSRTRSKRIPHLDLGAAVPKNKDSNNCRSLQYAIKSFFRVEERELVCSNCQHNKRRVELKISKLPRVLVVYLKRYDTHKISGAFSKNSLPVVIPKYITLCDFTSVDASFNFNEEDERCNRTDVMNESCSTVDSAVGSAHENGTTSDDKDVQGYLPADDIQLGSGPCDSGLGSECVTVQEPDADTIDLTQVPDVGDRQIDGCATSLLNESVDNGSGDHKRTSTPVNENNVVNAEMVWPIGGTEDEEFNEAICKSLENEEEEELEKAKLLSLQDLSRNVEEELDEPDDDEEVEDDDESDLLKENHSTGDLPDSYRLVSVAAHCGNATHGHYVCINYTNDSKWKTYNDDKVEFRTEKDALELARKDAYVMVYIHKSLV